MKKLGFLLCLLSGIASAQELDSLAADSVEKAPPAYYFGVYLDGGLSLSPSIPQRNFLGVYAVGIQYERWFVEGVIMRQLGTYQEFLIFPNVFTFHYRYGGVQVAYNLLEGKNVNIRTGVGYYRGAMLWRFLESGQDFLRDTFDMYKGYVTVEYDKFRYWKPYLALGYQKAAGIALTKVEDADFSGINAKVGLRIGFFNQ